MQQDPPNDFSRSRTLNIRGKFINVSRLQPFEEYYDHVENGSWEPTTFEIFEAFLDAQHSYVDLGAFIGITSLYGCQMAKKCYAIEPDPLASAFLVENVGLNPNHDNKIIPFFDCIHNQEGIVELKNISSDFGGDSRSSLIFGENKISWKMQAITLDQFFEREKINDCNFIKIDIEGSEQFVLPGMFNLINKFKPSLLIAFHGFYFNSLSDYLNTMIPILKVYKNIFLHTGKKISLSNVLDPKCFDQEIVFTDLPLEFLSQTEWGKRLTF